MTDQISNEWLQKVEAALLKSQQLPSAEEGFPFPWEHASSALADTLGIDNLKLSAGPSSWKTANQLSSGMGAHPIVFNLELAPIAGVVQWVVSSEDLATLVTHALTSDQRTERFSNRKFQQGFYNFLLLEAVEAIDKLKIFKDTTLRLLPAAPLSQEGGLSVDITLSFQNKTIHGRLISPQTFLDNFKAHQPIQAGGVIASETVKQTEVVLHLEAGNVALSPEEWKTAMPGDFITLDHCSYDPGSQKGSVMIMLGSSPLLRGRIKPEGVKIVEYAFYFEDQKNIEPIEEIFIADPLSSEEGPLWTTSGEEEMETAVKPEEETIGLSIQVGYIRITVGKLLELKPDTLLDLSIRPEQGVDASISGKTVAKGDLLKLGEQLGVRLLDIER